MISVSGSYIFMIRRIANVVVPDGLTFNKLWPKLVLCL
jgi:hypothetical protein